MRRVPPSGLIHEELDRLLTGGAGPEQNLISELVGTVTRLVVQQLLEGEQTDYLGGRGRCQPQDDEAGQRGSRNGYVDDAIRTAEGKIPIRMPQVRDTGEPFRSVTTVPVKALARCQSPERYQAPLSTFPHQN